MSSFTSFKLLEACREPGCPVCRLVQAAVERYLDNQFYENVNNPDWRKQLRTSLGFCQEHAWLAIERHLGDALGFAIIYQDVVATILKGLDESPPPSSGQGWSPARNRSAGRASAAIQPAPTPFTPRTRCPACLQRDEMTKMIIVRLIEELQGSEMPAALQASDGLCIPHLRLVLLEAKNSQTRKTLLDIHRRKLESLKSELEEFIRKNDYRFMSEGFGKEGDSWLRAVHLMTGYRKRKE